MSRLEAGVATQSRLHWLDGARASLMLLGIPFHAAMVYSTQGWEISSPETSELLTVFAHASGAFRMPAFFLVAGFFAAMMLAKRERLPFLRSRVVRLGVPLLTCLLLISPVQVWLLEVASRISRPSGPLARSFFNADGTPYGDAGRVWVAHLWFLIDLTLYTALLTALLSPANIARVKRIGGWLYRLPVLGIAIALCAHALYSFGLGAFDNLTGTTLPGPFWGAFSTQKWLFNLPFFMAGALCFHERRLLQAAISSNRWSVVAAAAVLLGFALWPTGGAAWQKALRLCLWPLASWAGLHLVLSACAHWLDRPSPIVRNLVDSAYSIYLFHLLFIFAGGLALSLVRWPVLLEFMLLVAVTLSGAWSIHQLMKRYATYRLLFNGEPAAPAALPRVKPQTLNQATD